MLEMVRTLAGCLSLSLLYMLAAAETPFQEKSRRAAQALEASRVDEAAALYRECLKLQPAWLEGWWRLGTLEYERNAYAAARDAFARFLKLKPGAPPALALLGLSEFEIKDYPAALQHLEQSLRGNGLATADESVSRSVRYHAGLLLLKSAQFERAIQRFSQAALLGGEHRDLKDALGLAGLRKPALPSDPSVSPADRTVAGELGQAMYFAATRQSDSAAAAFATLLEKFPSTPELHNMYGVFLLASDPDAALRAWRRELEISHLHIPARLQIAYEYLKRNQAAEGLPYARQAVELAPKLFVAHNALGRLLIDTGDLSGGIAALETAKRLAPDSAETRMNLASAYSQAGRKAEAARERAEFQRLKSLNPD